MIIPSIDIVRGETVQLVEGEQRVLTAGAPSGALSELSVVGEVAVVDIDAARGEGDNADLVADLCRRAPIRVGGGIRTAGQALSWLDRGAAKVIIGTAADEDLLDALPAERVIVALDARDGQIVTNGWRCVTGRGLLESILRFRGLAGGFLVTFVEREGRMQGTDLAMARQVIETAGESRVTIAGGIATTAEIATLDEMGADAQVGMALYTGRIDLTSAFAAPLGGGEGLWPTVVVDEHGVALGMAWSSRRSLESAMQTRRGVYESRRRGVWVKGQTSGATQELVAVGLDCDRDTLRFTVRQHDGFCHTGTRTCWGEDNGPARLARRLHSIVGDSPSGSNTAKLAGNPEMLAAKLVEEAGELARAVGRREVAEEAADLLYFALVKCAVSGVGFDTVAGVLDRRERRVSRRPMAVEEQP